MASDYEFDSTWKVGDIESREDNVDPADNVTIGFVVRCQKCRPGYTAKRVRLIIDLSQFDFDPSDESSEYVQELRDQANAFVGLQAKAGIVADIGVPSTEFTAAYFDKQGPDGAGFVSDDGSVEYLLGDFQESQEVQGSLVLKTGNCLGRPNALEGHYAIRCRIVYQPTPNKVDYPDVDTDVASLEFSVLSN